MPCSSASFAPTSMCSGRNGPTWRSRSTTGRTARRFLSVAPGRRRNLPISPACWRRSKAATSPAQRPMSMVGVPPWCDDPESGHRRVPPECPLSARFDQSAVQRKDGHARGSSHHGGTPTIDINRCAGDVAALLRRQQAGEIGKFLRLPGATERNLLAVRLVVLLERHVGPFRPLHMLVGANDADEHGIY